MFFKFAPERWSNVLFPKKLAFSLKNPLLPIISCKLLVFLSHFGQLGVKPLFFGCNTLIAGRNIQHITYVQRSFEAAMKFTK